jgi:hypothetical protein
MAQGWFRELTDDRLEVFLKAEGRKVRAHGPRADMFELVEWFERVTGVAVRGEWRRPARRGPRQIKGQLDMMQVTEEIPEEDEPGDKEVLTHE